MKKKKKDSQVHKAQRKKKPGPEFADREPNPFSVTY